MRKETALLPCPFCGGAAKLRSERYDGPPRTWTSVSCEICFVYTAGFDPEPCEEHGAVKAWNTRVGETIP